MTGGPSGLSAYRVAVQLRSMRKPHTHMPGSSLGQITKGRCFLERLERNAGRRPRRRVPGRNLAGH